MPIPTAKRRLFGQIARPALFPLAALGLLCAAPLAAQPVVDNPSPEAGPAASADSHSTVFDAVVGAQRYGQFVRALQQTGLVATVENSGPFTLLAPDDAAFAALGSKYNLLLQPENQAQLRHLVANHVVRGYLSYEDMRRQLDRNGGTGSLTTLDGSVIHVVLEKDGAISMHGIGKLPALVKKDELRAFNGTVLQLSAVVTPPALPKKPKN